MNVQLRLWIAVAIMLTAVPFGWAQQEESTIPATTQLPTTGTSGGQQTPAEEPTVPRVQEAQPLSGAEELQVTSPDRARNFVIPSLRLNLYGDTNRTILATRERAVEMTGSVIGTLALRRVNRRNEFVFDYRGGGMFFARNSELNSTMHEIGFTENYIGRRWGLTIGDRLSYLPESSYGFGGFGPSLGLGGGLGYLNPSFNPNQTLFTGRGSRIANSALAQIQYMTSSRTSLTFGGSYGLMRFREGNFIESDFGIANFGVNHDLSRRDSIAVIYGLGLYRFKGSDFHMDNHYAQLAYSRKLSGRLTFQVAAGPQVGIFRSPASGSQNTLSWNGHSSLNYVMSGTSLRFSYGHYTSTGSGLFYGATTDNFSGSISRRLTRNWRWSVSPGYARNTRLSQGPASSAASSYNSVHASTSFGRRVGRYTDFAFHYTLYEQWTSAQIASGVDTGSSLVRHAFGVTVAWHAPRIAMN